MAYRKKQSAQSSQKKRTTTARRPKGSVRKTSKPKPLSFTKRQMAQYVAAVKAKRAGEDE